MIWMMGKYIKIDLHEKNLLKYHAFKNRSSNRLRNHRRKLSSLKENKK